MNRIDWEEEEEHHRIYEEYLFEKELEKLENEYEEFPPSESEIKERFGDDYL